MRRSFDLFDTLIARRCIAPTLVFQLVEQKAGILGLAHLREVHGHQLWLEERPYSTEDIYAAVAKSLANEAKIETSQISRMARDWADLEYAVERSELIPVRRIWQDVQPTDGVISDMHHPDWVLQALARQAGDQMGVQWPMAMYKSNRGKHDGQFWQHLKQVHGSFVHCGDNPQSDVVHAQAAGHHALLTRWTELNQSERLLFESGLASVARAARSARLQCVGALTERMASFEAAFANQVFPVLALGAILLHQAMLQLKKTSIAFCGRDGATWLRVFSAIFPAVPAWVLPSSRKSLLGGSAGYRDYFLQAMGVDRSQVLLADLCGTGGSWAVFFERWQLEPQELVFLMQYQEAPERLDGKAWAEGLIDVKKETGAFVLETLCEASYPGLEDISPSSQSGDHASKMASLNYWVLHKEATSANQKRLAKRMEQVLDCALKEFAIERQRAQDKISGHLCKQVMISLIRELASLAHSVEAETEFLKRNRLSSDGYDAYLA